MSKLKEGNGCNNVIGVLLIFVCICVMLGLGSIGWDTYLKPLFGPTPIPFPLIGKILLLGNMEGGGLTIFEFKDGTENPQPLWIDISKYSLNPDKDEPIVVSEDGKYLMLLENRQEIMAVNLVTGEIDRIRLPHPVGNTNSDLDFRASFSPDNHYLAYALPGVGDKSVLPGAGDKCGLYLYDLIKNKNSIIFEGEYNCINWVGESFPFTQQTLLCGGVEGPIWIDNTKFFYERYANRPSERDESLIVSVDGTIPQQHKVSGPLPFISDFNTPMVKGPTLLFDRGYWINRANLADLTNLTVDRQKIEGYPLLLSSDGQFVLRRLDSSTTGADWRLTELRTGVDQPIYNHKDAFGSCKRFYGYRAQRIVVEEISWASDGKSIACINDDNALVLISLTSSSTRILLREFNGYLLAWWP